MRSFWLFELLRPVQVKLNPVGSARLHCSNPARQWIVEGRDSVHIDLLSPELQVTGPGDDSTWFQLEIGNQLYRDFFGLLDVRPAQDVLLITLTTSLEIGTNCVVGAELPVSAASPEALAAQAVVSRSVVYAIRSPRHACAHFCDTTHCQFFRSPSPVGSRVMNAVQSTGGRVMFQNGCAVPPRYSGACGGRTESGIDRGVRYSSVTCDPCLRRGLTRRGHGWGLCQEGAMALAASGMHYLDILRIYYPDLIVQSL